jgi:hypothetical protein
MMKYQRPAAIVLLGLLLAIVVHHTLIMIFDDSIRRSIDAGLALLNGRPHWRIVQNHLLGPFIARTLMRAAPGPDSGYLVFELIGFGGGLVLAWYAGFRAAATNAAALASMLTLTLGLAALFNGEAFYPWDVAGLPIFMGFAWLIAARVNYSWIVALFAVALWNRGDALFIALFLIIEPVVNWYRGRGLPEPARLDRLSIAVGFACVITGALLIILPRPFLLLEEPGLTDWVSSSNPNSFFRWMLVSNVNYVWNDISVTALSTPVFVVLPPMAAFGSCLWLMFADGGRYLGYALSSLALSAATFAFELILETRIWTDVLPTVVLAVAVGLAERRPLPAETIGS